MTVYILRRLLQSVVAVFLMSLIVFFGVSVVGDPVQMLVSPEMTQAEIEATIHGFGLDLPLYEQYFVFLRHVLEGDLGKSFIFGEPALRLVLQRMPATLELAFTALVLAIVLGVPLGLYAGLKPRAWPARLVMAGSILGFSLPTFWVGIVLILVFAVMLGWLPSTGRGATVDVLGLDLSLFTLDGLRHLILPALNLALLNIALVIRLARAGTLEVVHQDYIKFARAKGLSMPRIVFVHVLKNILIPVTTVLGLEFGSLIAFSVVTESIFAWPGMGKLLIDAILRLDRPLIVAYLMVIVVLFISINLIVDILYSLLDPRVRLQEQGA